ncbi:MAG: methyltransferase domain-containing protein [Pseudonocardiaceae bacterium]
MTGWQGKARELTQQLTDAGMLDPSWHAAFENTPRHIFVPRFYRHDMTVLDGSNPAHHREWLDAVYSDDSLPTRYAPVPGTDLMWPTSSSTKPSLMARMLTLLDVRSGHRVMEIGTGTGYNTALLCHRLGDGKVTSIDIDPDLVSTADTRLAELGHHPTLVTGDGVHGIPDAAPFDRIIATCAVPAVPGQWITQLREGGIIVTDLRGGISSNLTVFHKINPATVEGHVLTTPGHFMWLRPRVDNPLRNGDEFVTIVDRDDATQRLTQLDPGVLDHPDLRFLLQLREPTLQAVWRVIRDGTELLCVQARDGAWAEADVTERHGQHTVTQGGPRRVWDRIEHIATVWSQLGRPSADRFGLTVITDQQRLWLDTPESAGWWSFTTPPGRVGSP